MGSLSEAKKGVAQVCFPWATGVADGPPRVKFNAQLENVYNKLLYKLSFAPFGQSYDNILVASLCSSFRYDDNT